MLQQQRRQPVVLFAEGSAEELVHDLGSSVFGAPARPVQRYLAHLPRPNQTTQVAFERQIQVGLAMGESVIKCSYSSERAQ